MIRDRDGKFPALFDTILADTGIEIVLSGVRIPRMNSIMERWVHTCRCELLDRTLSSGTSPRSLRRTPTTPTRSRAGSPTSGQLTCLTYAPSPGAWTGTSTP